MGTNVIRRGIFPPVGVWIGNGGQRGIIYFDSITITREDFLGFYRTAEVDAKRRNGKLNGELRVDLHTKSITAGVIEYLSDEVRGSLLRARSSWFLKPYFCSTGLCSDLWTTVAEHSPRVHSGNVTRLVVPEALVLRS